jgi:Sec-independent protein translocase protein TatA
MTVLEQNFYDKVPEILRNILRELRELKEEVKELKEKANGNQQNQ